MSRPQKCEPVHNLSPPNPHKIHIPSPKSTRYEPRPLPTIPGLRRNVFQRYQYDAPTRNYAVQHLAVTELFGKIMHMYDTQGHKASLDSQLKGDTSTVWETSLSDELGRIVQGIGKISGTDVVDYIKMRIYLLTG